VKADKIYLVGFMGCGKSTVARGLARRLDWQPADIDELIEKREHDSVANVFAKRGEAYFRAVERTVLFEQLGSRHMVVATGGGTFIDPQNRAAINADGLSVWIDVPLERLIARVPADGRRPLANDRVAFEQLYASRRPAYALAHHRIEGGRGPAAGLVEQLVDWLET
jgi:shikimate kinase